MAERRDPALRAATKTRSSTASIRAKPGRNVGGCRTCCGNRARSLKRLADRGRNWRAIPASVAARWRAPEPPAFSSMNSTLSNSKCSSKHGESRLTPSACHSACNFGSDAISVRQIAVRAISIRRRKGRNPTGFHARYIRTVQGAVLNRRSRHRPAASPGGGGQRGWRTAPAT